MPRVFEKVHTAVLAKFDDETGAKRKIVDWALGVGRKASQRRAAGKPLGPVLGAQHRLADRLVYSKVKANLGGRFRIGISGGAPLAKEIAEFFHSLDVLILEGYGLTECTTAANSTARAVSASARSARRSPAQSSASPRTARC